MAAVASSRQQGNPFDDSDDDDQGGGPLAADAAPPPPVGSPLSPAYTMSFPDDDDIAAAKNAIDPNCKLYIVLQSPLQSIN